MKTLKLSTKNLTIETTKIVRTECPIAHVTFNKNFEFNKHCKDCNWNIEDNKCGWYVYETDMIKQEVEYDEDDGTGALPFESYYIYIKCYNCNSEVKYHSGYSWFSFGDVIKCKNCGNKFMYIGSKNEKLIFGMPYKQMKELEKRVIVKDDFKDAF